MDGNDALNVNAQLDLLGSQQDWQPDVNSAFACFAERRSRTAAAARRSWLACMALASCVLLAALLEFRGVSASDRILKDRQQAPDFTLQDARGATIRLSSYKNKVVVLNFWATWCGGCKVEIPWFVEFQSRYKDRGFTVIGVSMDDDGFQAVRPFLLEKKLNYPVVIGNQRLVKLYGVESMPETVLIDGRGRIAAFHLGLVDKPSLEREIRTLLD
jgi:peroxiredoxin